MDLSVIGWKEWIYLPDFEGSTPLKAKIDTGARSSALDATNIVIEHRDNEQVEVSFRLQLERERDQRFLDLKMPAELIKVVRSSNNQGEERPFIKVPVSLGEHHWTIQASLTDRSAMIHRMLLGRSALKRRFLVDTANTYIFGEPTT